MIQICHITTVHPRYDVRIFEKECTSLVEKGYEVTLLVNDQKEDEKKNGVRIISLRTKPQNRIDRAIRISNKIYKKAIGIDAEIYHIHDPELLHTAVRLSKHGKKVIFDSHEFTAMQILTKSYLPKILRPILAYIYRNYETSALNRLTGLIVPCTYNGQDYFKKISIPKIVIGNYPKLSLIDKYKNYEVPRDKEKICYVGGISTSRGVFQMAKAARLAGKKLVLIGEVPEDVRARLEKMSEYENIEVLGKQPHDIAMHEVAKCSIGLSLLQNEGQYANLDNLPTKVYEYMALGMPAVISDFPYYKKTIEKYQYGIAVDSSREEEIVGAIQEILSNNELYEKMVKEGKRAIYEEMNWEIEANKLAEFYQQLVRN